jgi:hypothetical protein
MSAFSIPPIRCSRPGVPPERLETAVAGRRERELAAEIGKAGDLGDAPRF